MKEVVIAILLVLEGSGYNLGYRLLWKRLRNVYKLRVKQKTVMVILKSIDPEGVEARKRHKLKRRPPMRGLPYHARMLTDTFFVEISLEVLKPQKIESAPACEDSDTVLGC